MPDRPDSPSPAREHWDRVYANKAPDAVSWYQPVPSASLAMIDAARAARAAHVQSTARPFSILDVGGGASTLVDHLVAMPGTAVTVVDIAAAALDHARARLGPDRAAMVHWLVADATGRLDQIPTASVDLWHDRAAFHFLTTPAARRDYARTLARVLRPGGTAVVATFAPDGPEKCSGLPVERHDAASIARELSAGGRALRAVRWADESHTTPWGATQKFVYAMLTDAAPA